MAIKINFNGHKPDPWIADMLTHSHIRTCIRIQYMVIVSHRQGYGERSQRGLEDQSKCSYRLANLVYTSSLYSVW